MFLFVIVSQMSLVNEDHTDHNLQVLLFREKEQSHYWILNS